MSTITKYFVGGEVEAFYQAGGSNLGWSTSAGTYDSNFSRGSVYVNNFSTFVPVVFTSAQNTFWFSAQINYQNSGGLVNTTWINFVDVTLTPMYRVQGIGGTQFQPIIQFQYWNGSSWIAAPGTAIICPSNTLFKLDVNIDNATTGIKAYINGIPFASGTGLVNYSIAQVQITEPAGGGVSVYVSEVMCFDVSTLGRRLYTLGETANGTNSQWTGAYTDINEIGTFNDANFIQTGSNNQTSTFVTSTIASVAAQQYLVSGLIVAGRMLIGAVGPQNMKGSVVVGGVTYNSTSNVANLLTNFGYTWADFPVNPATSADWTVTGINAGIETGWESLA